MKAWSFACEGYNPASFVEMVDSSMDFTVSDILYVIDCTIN